MMPKESAVREQTVKHLKRQLGYSFKDEKLLAQALTHRSAGFNNNERLEFLGDSVLNFIIAHALYEQQDRVDEGALSRLRASLVCGKTLAEIGVELSLGEHFSMGPGELKSGGFRRESIIADGLEAILGAVYLDGGFEACQAVVLRLFRQRLESLPEASVLKDPKTRLQEWLQSKGLELPQYALIDSFGKDHERTFVVECLLPSQAILTRAQSSSRRKAEQIAASEALTAVMTESRLQPKT